MNFEKTNIINSEIDSEKYVVNFRFKDIFANGITGISHFNARLYGFETKKEAQKYKSEFVKYMKAKLGKSVGKMDNQGFMKCSGVSYCAKISDSTVITKISDIKNYSYPTIQYYTV